MNDTRKLTVAEACVLVAIADGDRSAVQVTQLVAAAGVTKHDARDAIDRLVSDGRIKLTTRLRLSLVPDPEKKREASVLRYVRSRRRGVSGETIAKAIKQPLNLTLNTLNRLLSSGELSTNEDFEFVIPGPDDPILWP